MRLTEILKKFSKLISIVLIQEHFATIQNEKKKLEYYSSFLFRKTGSNIWKEQHTILTLLKWQISARDFFTAPFVHRKHSPENLDL